MITLFGVPRSRSLRVSWTLEELGLDWSYQYIDFSRGAHKDAEFLALNPAGKVPALKDGDLLLTESAAICLYLAEKYGDRKLLPQPGGDESGVFHRWVSFIICELEQPLWSIGKHKFALPEEQRIPQMLSVGSWEFNKAANIAELWTPEQGFLLGETFTVADILLGHTLNWAVRFDQVLPSKLAAYRERVSARPALSNALNKELAGAGQGN